MATPGERQPTAPVPLSYADYYYIEGLLRLRAVVTAADPSP